MEHREQPYPCQVVRHGGARRMTLRVAASGTRLTVPARASARQIDAFLRASEPWVAEQRGRLAPAPAPLRDGDRLAYLDGALDLRVVPTGGGRRRAAREGTRLVVATHAGEDPGAVIEGWYRREAARVVAPRARASAATLGGSAGRIAIRDPRSRWGSCSSTGTLSFSWRLLLAPEAVLDYVVAHEACHLLRPDHSPAFWALVAEAFPGHAGARSWLRENGARLHRGPGWRWEGLSPS